MIVEIFGRPNCVWCEKAKKLAQDYGLPWHYKDITEGDTMTEFRFLFPEAKTVPQIMWDGRRIGGYSEFAVEIENTIGGYGEQQC
jgi:glutaredoxin